MSDNPSDNATGEPSGALPGHKPRRADPVQPDAPGKGLGSESAADEAAEAQRKRERSDARMAEQNKAAHDNVRQGYD